MTTQTFSPKFNRRTLIQGAAALGAFQVASPFIIQARGETPIRMGMVDPLTGVYAAPAGNEVMGAKLAVEQNLMLGEKRGSKKPRWSFADMYKMFPRLKEREHTGKGSYIDMALMDSIVGVLANQATYYLVSGKPPVRMGNAHASDVLLQVGVDDADLLTGLGVGLSRLAAENQRRHDHDRQHHPGGDRCGRDKYRSPA